MTIPNRFCVTPYEIALLYRDGIGWGHDLESGCLSTGLHTMRPGLLRRITRGVKMRLKNWM